MRNVSGKIVEFCPQVFFDLTEKIGVDDEGEAVAGKFRQARKGQQEVFSVAADTGVLGTVESGVNDDV